MKSALTRTQIDRLGDRLRAGAGGAEDLQLLDEYRTDFGDPLALVLKGLRSRLRIEPTGRIKVRQSIAQKLTRERTRLSQMQDIAGCRLVVPDLAAQEQVGSDIARDFEVAKSFDRRAMPSHGYRAVHLVLNATGRFLEVQVRTELQHLWAELSEKSADLFGIELKYGGGDEKIRAALADLAVVVQAYEHREAFLLRSPAHPDVNEQASEAADALRSERQHVLDVLRSAINMIGRAE